MNPRAIGASRRVARDDNLAQRRARWCQSHCAFIRAEPFVDVFTQERLLLSDVDLVNGCLNLVKRDSCSELLWHYTSTDAAVRIVENTSVHLACHAFMNDPAEGRQSLSLVTECWHNAIDKGCNPKLAADYVRDTTRALRYFDVYRPETPPTFIFSLSTLRDSLSQWSRYAADGSGVALGFKIDATKFDRPTRKEWCAGPELHEVLYDWGSVGSVSNSVETAKFRADVTELMCEFARRICDPTESDNGLISLAHNLRPIIKHGSYHEEREWRVVFRTVEDSTSLYKVRSNRIGFVPFVELPLNPALVLTDIMLGPKLSKENLWSAKWLCRKHGLNDVEVSQSSLAYR